MKKLTRTLLVMLVFGWVAACQQQPQIEEKPNPELVTGALPDHAFETLDAFVSAEPPTANHTEIALRLNGTVADPIVPSTTQVGEMETVWYREGGTNNTQIEAELRYQSDSLAMWFEDGVRVSADDVEEAAEHIENEIFPTTRAFFGNEQPGTDGDERVHILHLRQIGGIGSGTEAAGYFTDADQLPTNVNQFSNERDILYISLNAAKVGSDDYYHFIAHEMQHMIHAYSDLNEQTWLNEGMAELSNYINGNFEFDTLDNYSQLTDIPLTDWEYGSAESIGHYGASFLFSAYFLERFGEEAAKNVVSNPTNGLDSFGEILAQANGSTVEQLFGDWAVANLLSSVSQQVGDFGYDEVTVSPIDLSAEIDTTPTTIEGGVHQFGIDYVKISGTEPIALTFEGSTQVTVLDTDPSSGDYFVSTLPGDSSDMTLTRAFDLTGVTADEATLSFQTWYEIEAGWDYGYILISADNGSSWDMQRTIYSTEADLQGNNYGIAITGVSKGGVNIDDGQPRWTEINIDISDYIGQEILLRFEYITDGAVFYAGWALDDIRIDAIGYSEDFENGLNDWQTAGWVRHTNILPQTYIVQAVYLGDGVPRIEQLPLDATQQGTFTLALDNNYDEVVLTISGSTPITTQRTAYKLTLE